MDEVSRMRSKGPRLSPGTAIGCVALLLALAGTAYAAGKIGSKQLKAGAVTTKKLKNGAVSSAKLADGAVNSAKLADGSVSASKLADGAVSTGKLADGAVASSKIAGSAVTTQELTPEERSEGFESKAMDNQPVSTVDFGTLTTLSLPAGGHYLVNVTASFANEAAVANSVLCRVRDDGAFVTEGVATLAPAVVYSATLSLVGESDGGSVALTCTADQSALAKAVVMTAIRVASIEVQP